MSASTTSTAKKKQTAKASSHKIAENKKPATRGPAKAKLLSSKLTYKGRVFSVYTDHVLEPGGVKGYRDIIKHNGSVVIRAADETNADDPSVIIIRQYRHAAGQFLLELPAGKLDAGETPLQGAKREMIEETGYSAKKWTKLVRYYASPGFLGEWMEIWLATGIVEGVAQPEEDEHISVRKVPLSQLQTMVLSGKIHDGKTIIGTMVYAARRTAKIN